MIIDIGGCFNGYYGDFTRIWVCGNMVPTAEQVELHQLCYDGLHRGCAACVPGNTFDERLVKDIHRLDKTTGRVRR